MVRSNSHPLLSQSARPAAAGQTLRLAEAEVKQGIPIRELHDTAPTVDNSHNSVPSHEPGAVPVGGATRSAPLWINVRSIVAPTFGDIGTISQGHRIDPFLLPPSTSGICQTLRIWRASPEIRSNQDHIAAIFAI